MTKWLCPKCGAPMGFFTGLSNYYEVFKLGKEPVYISEAKCTQCDFETKRYPEDDDRILDEIVVIEEDKEIKCKEIKWLEKCKMTLLKNLKNILEKL